MSIIVGMSGATGAIYAVRLLELLKSVGVETHFVATKSAVLTLGLETPYQLGDLQSLATHSYSPGNVGASISSGSFRTRGMIVAPCSVKTLSGIAHCYEDNLLLRAAGVTLKERRPLVMLFRETPLHEGHLRLMSEAARMGGMLFPPVPAFYTRPTTVQDIVDQTCGRVLDQFGIDVGLERWSGVEGKSARSAGPRIRTV